MYALVRATIVCLLVSGLASHSNAWAQSTEPVNRPGWSHVSDIVLDRLPKDWRPVVGKYVILPKKEFEDRCAKMKDDELLGEMLSRLADVDGPQEFVLDHMQDPAVPDPGRLQTVYDIAYYPHWLNNTRADSVLKQIT